MTTLEPPPSANVTPVGLALDDGLTVDAWAEAGRRVVLTQQASMWWVGDWLLYAEDRFTDADLIEAHRVARAGFEPSTIRSALSVARAFSVQRRHDRLSWSHHEAVSAQPPSDADTFLDEAERDRLSVMELRESVRRRTAPGGSDPDDKPERQPAGSQADPTDQQLAAMVRQAMRNVDAGVTASGRSFQAAERWYLLTIEPSTRRGEAK